MIALLAAYPTQTRIRGVVINDDAGVLINDDAKIRFPFYTWQQTIFSTIFQGCTIIYPAEEGS